MNFKYKKKLINKKYEKKRKEKKQIEHTNTKLHII